MWTEKPKRLKGATFLRFNWSDNRRAGQIITIDDWDARRVNPYFEKMADLESFSTDWLAELTTATQLTADSVPDLVVEEDELDRLIDDALGKENSK